MFTMLVNYTTQSERGEICDKREIHTKKSVNGCSVCARSCLPSAAALASAQCAPRERVEEERYL